jgi:thioredoxin reductase (NADPH)
MTTHHTKVLIIGSGAAGCTAAIYAARAGLEPMLVRGMQPGGQLTITTDLENYPGFAEAVQGPWLMEQMEQQALNVGTRVINDVVTSVDLSKRPFNISCDSGDNFIAETLIIATGASARWLGIEGEAEFQNYGVSACATCDGFFYRNKEVVVIGGGNSAVEEALFLANIASKVTLIHRRDSLKAEKIAQDRLFKHPKVSVVWNSAPIAFLGDDEPRSLTGVKVRNTIDGSESIVSTHGAFVAIGHEPNTDLFKGQLEVDEFNYLITKPDSTATSIKGVYAAGDVQDRIYRQAITAAGTGCMAALEAERFLSHHES